MKLFSLNTELVPFIESIWYDNHNVNKQRVRKIIPDGSCEIIINLADPYQMSYDGVNYKQMEGINLFPIRHKLTYLIQGKKSKAMGIRLKPFALYILIGKPLAGLITTTTSLNNILPELHSSLLNLPDTESAAIETLQSIFIKSLNKNLSWRDHIAEGMYQKIELKKGVTSVGFLIDQFGISYKYIERLFLKYFGIAPQKYIRCRRMHFALTEINRATTKPDFMTIVAKYAFHDQSHLIREFIDLTGVSPLSLYEENNTLQKFYGNIESV